jgi:hypothetical protein
MHQFPPEALESTLSCEPEASPPTKRVTDLAVLLGVVKVDSPVQAAQLLKLPPL